MTFIDLLKKYGLLAAVILASDGNAQQSPRGLIGGLSNSSAYAATIVGNSVESQILFLPNGIITSVAINNIGQGLIGGQITSSAPYAAYIPPSSNTAIQIFNLPSTGVIESVAINNLGQGLIGGFASTNGYAAVLAPGSNAAQQILFLSGGGITSVAINSSGKGLIGGLNGTSGGYAAFTSPTDGAAQILNLPAVGQINGVAINDSGQCLIGGFAGAMPVAYVATVSGNVATPVFTDLTTVNSRINTVAINSSGLGLIGGVGNLTGAYAAILSSTSNVVTPILNLSDGTIQSVAINDAGQGLIGGIGEGGGAYAAYIASSSSRPATVLNLSSGNINSVAINAFGQGVIGGFSNSIAYAAIISPNMATPISLYLPDSSTILSVSIMNLLTSISTNGIRGNSLKFADYINANAPQDAFYFVPALFDGTLADALESAAPTRNAISFNTVMQNAFYLTTSLSSHLHNHQFMQKRGRPTKPNTTTASRRKSSRKINSWLL